MSFKKGDIVFYYDNRVTVVEGPFRRDGHPDADQYKVSGSNGGIYFAWGADLVAEEEYHESLTEDGPPL